MRMCTISFTEFITKICLYRNGLFWQLPKTAPCRFPLPLYLLELKQIYVNSMCWSPKTKHANCTKKRKMEHFSDTYSHGDKCWAAGNNIVKMSRSVHYQLRAFPFDILQASSAPPPTSAVKSQQQKPKKNKI